MQIEKECLEDRGSIITWNNEYVNGSFMKSEKAIEEENSFKNNYLVGIMDRKRTRNKGTN